MSVHGDALNSRNSVYVRMNVRSQPHIEIFCDQSMGTASVLLFIIVVVLGTGEPQHSLKTFMGCPAAHVPNPELLNVTMVFHSDYMCNKGIPLQATGENQVVFLDYEDSCFPHLMADDARKAGFKGVLRRL